MVLDSADPRNPHLLLTCPTCGLPIAYMGTHGGAEGEPDMHIYRCREHGLIQQLGRIASLDVRA